MAVDASSVRRELADLLGRLKGVRSPLRRIRLLTQGWKTLRQLNPAQLKQLAADVGFDGAEDLMRQLTHGKGLDPHVLIKALSAAREIDAEELERVQQTMRDPDRRALLMSRGIDAVADVIEPEAETVEAVVDEEPEPPARAPEPAAPPPPPLQPDPARAEPALTLDWSTAPTAPRSVPPAAAEAPAPRAEAKSTLRRLRELRERLDELHSADRDELRRLVGSFPSGWARRRALNALLEAGIPSDAGQARELLDLLESPVSRRWCETTIRRRSRPATSPVRRR